MIGLLTWATFGSWLPGPARGRVDPDGRAESRPLVPEPDRLITTSRRRGLKWPVVTLGHDQRALVLRDLARLAALREFEPIIAVAAVDHVHLLIDVDPDRPVERLVQLVKGSLSRTLSTAMGNAPATDRDGLPLAHRKWWTHQYSFRRIGDPIDRFRVERRLLDHDAEGAAVRTEWR